MRNGREALQWTAAHPGAAHLQSPGRIREEFAFPVMTQQPTSNQTPPPHGESAINLFVQLPQDRITLQALKILGRYFRFKLQQCMLWYGHQLFYCTSSMIYPVNHSTS